MKRAALLLLALFMLFITGLAVSNIGPVHAAGPGDFSLTNKNCYPRTATCATTNLGVPNGSAPSFNITVTNLLAGANSVAFTSTQNATGPVVTFYSNTVNLNAAGTGGASVDNVVTISASAAVP